MSDDTNIVLTNDEAQAAAEAAKQNEKLMTRLMSSVKSPPALGDLIDGTVIASVKGKVFVDLPPWGTGLIYGREYQLRRK